jgi:hypothetical protein
VVVVIRVVVVVVVVVVVAYSPRWTSGSKGVEDDLAVGWRDERRAEVLDDCDLAVVVDNRPQCQDQTVGSPERSVVLQWLKRRGGAIEHVSAGCATVCGCVMVVLIRLSARPCKVYATLTCANHGGIDAVGTLYQPLSSGSVH